MAIRGVCPECGIKFLLHMALDDAAARQALMSALEIAPSLAGRIIKYLGLFSPGERAMRMDALAARLEELAAAIKNAEVERDGRTWSAPLDYWRDGIDHMLNTRDKLRLPLKDHNYLFAIVANTSMKVAGKKEARREKQRKDHPEGERSGMQKVGNAVDHLATGKARVQGLKASLKGSKK